MSAKSLPSNEKKPIHFWGFIVIGVIAVVLTVFVGIRNAYAQKDAARMQSQLSSSLQNTSNELFQANQMLQQSRYSEEFMKGQLSGLSLMVGKIGSAGDSGNATLAKALLLISSQTLERNPPGPTGFKGFNNADLKAKALEMVKNIGTIELAYEKSDTDSMNQRYYDVNKNRAENDRVYAAAEAIERQGRQQELMAWLLIHVECGMLIDEMLSRLPSDVVPKDPFELSIIKMTIQDGALAGAYPLRIVSSYVEKLALLLPQKKPAK